MVRLAEQCSPVPSIVLPLDAILLFSLHSMFFAINIIFSVGLTDPNLKWALLLGVGGAVRWRWWVACPTMAIKFVLLVNKQGQTRVAQYYEYKVCHDAMPCCEPRKVRAAPLEFWLSVFSPLLGPVQGRCCLTSLSRMRHPA